MMTIKMKRRMQKSSIYETAHDGDGNIKWEERMPAIDNTYHSLTVNLSINKAVYTAALVADGWAGEENLEKQLCYQPTDQPTDQKVAYRVVSLRPKKGRYLNNETDPLP